MPGKKLEQLLIELEQQIGSTDDLDNDLKGRLEQLKSAIELRLGETDDAGGAKNLVEPLRQAIDEFEDSHPTLTMTLGRIMDVLNKIGI